MKPKEILEKDEIQYPNMTEEHLGSINEELIRRTSLAVWKYFEENNVPIEEYLKDQGDIVQRLYKEHGKDLSEIVDERHTNKEQFDTAARLAAKMYYEGYENVIEKFENLDFPGVGVTKWQPTIDKYEPTEKELKEDQEKLEQKAQNHDKDNT